MLNVEPGVAAPVVADAGQYASFVAQDIVASIRVAIRDELNPVLEDLGWLREAIRSKGFSCDALPPQANGEAEPLGTASVTTPRVDQGHLTLPEPQVHQTSVYPIGDTGGDMRQESQEDGQWHAQASPAVDDCFAPLLSCRELFRGPNDQSEKGDYQLVGQSDQDDVEYEIVSGDSDAESRCPSARSDVSHDEMTDSRAAARLEKEIAALEVQEMAADKELADFDDDWDRRRLPYLKKIDKFHEQLMLPKYKDDAALKAKAANVEEELANLDGLSEARRMPCVVEIDRLRKLHYNFHYDLSLAQMPRHITEHPRGPRCLKFIDSLGFNAACNVIVGLNLTTMVLAMHAKSKGGSPNIEFVIADHFFLLWYTIEVSLKAIYYQKHLLIGRVSVVWWNWLDLSIVLSGILDQWIMPLVRLLNPNGAHVDLSAIKLLRFLRLFRLLRVLKILRALLAGDLAWAHSTQFDILMTSIITINAVVMSLELDYDSWGGWIWVENFFLVMYSFELFVKLKSKGCLGYFIEMEHMFFNYLDVVMVIGGMLDLWFMPLADELREVITGETGGAASSLQGFLKILRIMRILRVLRLVRLMKVITPLYRLLMGVIEAFQAMQWVMLLTLLVLYACAIVFTSLVGKGFISGGDISEAADNSFGSVPKSLFSLFKLMNGDTSVVDPICNNIAGQLLFAIFMVISNWAILAILTSVVSDNMMQSSAKALEEDATKRKRADDARKTSELITLFKEIDQDGSGFINSAEWNGMMEDKGLRYALCKSTDLEPDDLKDYFGCLSLNAKETELEENDLATAKVEERKLRYDLFIENLKEEGNTADKRSILHLASQLRELENRMVSRFEDVDAECKPTSAGVRASKANAREPAEVFRREGS